MVYKQHDILLAGTGFSKLHTHMKQAHSATDDNLHFHINVISVTS